MPLSRHQLERGHGLRWGGLVYEDLSEHRLRLPVALVGVARMDDLVREVQRVDQTLLRRLGGFEHGSAHEVDVLVVDGASFAAWSEAPGYEKAPPVPEDGGELGVQLTARIRLPSSRRRTRGASP